MNFSIKDFFSKWTKSAVSCEFGHIFSFSLFFVSHFTFGFLEPDSPDFCYILHPFYFSLRGKCTSTEFFLVRIFLYSDQKKTPYLDIFHAVSCTLNMRKRESVLDVFSCLILEGTTLKS